MAKQGVYEVWDKTTGNRIGESLTLEMALEGIPVESAEDYLLCFEDRTGRTTRLATGQDLRQMVAAQTGRRPGPRPRLSWPRLIAAYLLSYLLKWLTDLMVWLTKPERMR
jgi:hypothetical protein